jgi:hypothetical protein
MGPPAPQPKAPYVAPKASAPELDFFQTPLDKALGRPSIINQAIASQKKQTGGTIQGFPADFVKAQSGNKTTATGPTYESIKGGIKQNITSLTQNEIKVILAPPNAKFTDASGKEYTKTEAIRQMQSGQRSLRSNLSTVESFESKGYQVRQGSEGSFEFFKTPEQIKAEGISEKKTQLETSMSGDAGQRLAGLGSWVTTSFLSWEDPFSIKSTAQAIMGDREGAIKTKATAMYDLDTAIKEGPGSYVLKVSTGPFATVGTAFIGGSGINIIEGRLAAGATAATLAGSTGAKAVIIKAAPLVFKGGMIATGAVFGTMMAEDVYTTYKTDPLLALAKGVTYAGAIGAGVKGYKAAGGSKGITNKIMAAEDKFYESHPERIRMVFMKEGAPVEPTGSLQKSKGTGWDFESNKNIAEFTSKFQKNPENFKVSLLEQEVIGNTKTKGSGGLDWGKPEASIFTSRGGTRSVSRFTLKGIKEYKPGTRDIAMSKSAADKIGPRVEIDYMGIRNVKGGELFVGEEGGVKTRPLYKDLGFSEIAGRTGEIKVGKLGRGGKRIFDFDFKRIEYAEDLSSSERGGGGGFAKTKTIQVQEYDLGSLSDVFFKTGSRSGSLVMPVFAGTISGTTTGVINKNINKMGELQGPVFKGEGDLDIDILTNWQSPGFRSGQDTIPKTIDVVDTSFDTITGKNRKFDTITETTFDFVTETTQETIPVFETTSIPGFQFKAPGFTLTGFEDESGSLISVFGRHREYRTGNLQKALKDFGAMFT